MSKADIERIRIQSVLKRHEFVFKKKYGQNFITDEAILNDIADAAEIEEDDYVLEIGPGMGTLTRVLSKKAAGVIAVEIDDKLIPVLEEELADFKNVTVINDDIMRMDIAGVMGEKVKGRAIKVVANLPYYITTPIIMMLLESDLNYHSITVMVQKEVAQRMVSPPGTKDYGAITLAIKYYTKASIVFTLEPDAFFPPPKVESAVITLKRNDRHPVEVADERLMFELIRAAFMQRRKTLVNAINNQTRLNIDKEEITDIICGLGHPATIRGEALSLSEFAALSDKISCVRDLR